MKLILIVLTSLIMMQGVLAQSNSSSDVLQSTQTDLMIVAGAGLAGGILGLSTLSFTEKPSKHLSNIWTGAAVGIIAGVVYVAYSSAQRGQEELRESSVRFDTSERVAWHFQQLGKNFSTPPSIASSLWTSNF